MKAIAVFSKGEHVLTKFEINIARPVDVRKAMTAAYDAFRKQNPSTSLFDNFSVLWSQGDDAS